ncbi:hypothetical protein HYQ46_006057 [Verticillium longisporum]|nr:hypothetical protein HYQ46_006057 [Verticillium longisporum]
MGLRHAYHGANCQLNRPRCRRPTVLGTLRRGLNDRSDATKCQDKCSSMQGRGEHVGPRASSAFGEPSDWPGVVTASLQFRSAIACRMVGLDF